ncbi:MAG: hypothetical protein JNK82_06325 [Myxococcaceae bacterium]|nr:hypothetical protein [Myxococcaceae bacterium]
MSRVLALFIALAANPSMGQVGLDSFTDSECLALLERTPDPIDDRTLICPDERGEVNRWSQGLAEVFEVVPFDPMGHDLPPRVPAEPITFSDQFWNEGEYSVCKDIFHEEPFLSAVMKLPAASGRVAREALSNAGERVFRPDEVQLRMATVFTHVEQPTWEFESPMEEGRELYGCIEVHRRRFPIRLYRGACDAKALYSYDLRVLGPMLRLELIAAHELGHAIDALTGDLSSRPLAAETRATVYASFLAQCSARTMRTFFLEAARAITSPLSAQRRRKAQLVCMARRWHTFEQYLASARAGWTSSEPRLSPGFSSAFACASPAADGAQASLSVHECPVRTRQGR